MTETITLSDGRTLDGFVQATDTALAALTTSVSTNEVADAAAIASLRGLLDALSSKIGTGPAPASPVVLTQTADFTITLCVVSGQPGAQSIQFHGGWVADMPAAYDYTLDGGKTWVAAGGFGDDGGTFDTWVYGLTIPPGTYTAAVRDRANPSHIAIAPSFTVVPNTAPALIAFDPIRFSTSLPTGTPIGVVKASGGTPQYPLTIKIDAAATSPGYSVVADPSGGWLVSVSDQSSLVAGINTLAGTVSSGPLSTAFNLSFGVVAGITVPPSALTLTQSALNNATPVGSPAFTLAIAGYTGGTFAITSQAAPGNPSTNMPPRYAVTGAAGTTANTLSAQTETIDIVWTDGVNTCVAALPITVADLRGSGKQIAVADQAGLTSTMTAIEAAAAANAGAVITLAPGTYETGWTVPGGADGWDDNTILSPQTLQSAPGVMPVFRQGSQWIANGKGWIETFGWDAALIGLEFADLAQTYPGEVGNFAGLKINAGLLGSYLAKWCYFHGCTNGVQGGDFGQLVQIIETEFAKCGGGDGFTHNFYIGAAYEAIVDKVVSWGANVGHCGKIRARQSTVTDSVFADGLLGCASYLLDFPDGGVHVVSGGVTDKGPNAQNSPLISFGEECQNHWAVNSLLVENHTFINRAVNPPKLPNGDLIYPVGVSASLVSGAPAIITVQNSTFYGFDAALFGPGSPFVANGSNVTLNQTGNKFLPLSEAPDPTTYMSHPWQGGGYSSSTTALAGYLAGPMAGK